MKVNELITEQTDLTLQRLEGARQELRPILVLMQSGRAALLNNNTALARTEIQRALAKYETVLPILNKVLETARPL